MRLSNRIADSKPGRRFSDCTENFTEKFLASFCENIDTCHKSTHVLTVNTCVTRQTRVSHCRGDSDCHIDSPSHRDQVTVSHESQSESFSGWLSGILRLVRSLSIHRDRATDSVPATVTVTVRVL